ncbi:RDD family protein [Thiomicrospira cyclica]|uniref:RDD domain containing protein n=1 Tax=Thiomicrospira cyclica (strain DSM 14477 / JCM 11371 / ALM1) TaxID=717773 RepID=F6DBB6_THICA|nr:RDD family protein [Thiomicrospira cyclica]AEG31224.1 RDD domain containing protein [Thiomicrospira cyclica ALM1]
MHKTKIIFALLYDLLLLMAVWFFVAIPFVLWQGNSIQTSSATLFAFQVYLLGTTYIYLSYFWLQTGQTPGLRTWQLQLVRTDGYILTRRDSYIRFLFSIISVATLGLGWLWLFFNNRHQTFHDMMANTQIIAVKASDDD